jgi:hypothetical protein
LIEIHYWQQLFVTKNRCPNFLTGHIRAVVDARRGYDSLDAAISGHPLDNSMNLPDPPAISPDDAQRTRSLDRPYATIRIAAVAVVIAVLALFFYPPIHEGVVNECSAVEVSALRAATHRFAEGRNSLSHALSLAVGNSLQQVSDGAIASRLVKIGHPNLPAKLGCTVAYYRLLFHPEDWQRYILPLPGRRQHKGRMD